MTMMGNSHGGLSTGSQKQQQIQNSVALMVVECLVFFQLIA